MISRLDIFYSGIIDSATCRSNYWALLKIILVSQDVLYQDAIFYSFINYLEDCSYEYDKQMSDSPHFKSFDELFPKKDREYLKTRLTPLEGSVPSYRAAENRRRRREQEANVDEVIHDQRYLNKNEQRAYARLKHAFDVITSSQVNIELQNIGKNGLVYTLCKGNIRKFIHNTSSAIIDRLPLGLGRILRYPLDATNAALHAGGTILHATTNVCLLFAYGWIGWNIYADYLYYKEVMEKMKDPDFAFEGGFIDNFLYAVQYTHLTNSMIATALVLLQHGYNFNSPKEDLYMTFKGATHIYNLYMVLGKTYDILPIFSIITLTLDEGMIQFESIMNMSSDATELFRNLTRGEVTFQTEEDKERKIQEQKDKKAILQRKHNDLTQLQNSKMKVALTAAKDFPVLQQCIYYLGKLNEEARDLIATVGKYAQITAELIDNIINFILSSAFLEPFILNGSL